MQGAAKAVEHIGHAAGQIVLVRNRRSVTNDANAKPLATIALMIGTRGVCEQYSRPAFAGGTCDVH